MKFRIKVKKNNFLLSETLMDDLSHIDSKNSSKIVFNRTDRNNFRPSYQ